MAGPAVGISLGTSFSSVAFWKDDHLQIIRNEDGDTRIPSIVSFLDDKRIAGIPPSQAIHNLENTMFDLKRIIGRKFHEPCLQQQTRFWPFQVVSTPSQEIESYQQWRGGPPRTSNHLFQRAEIGVESEGARKIFSPEELIAILLGKLIRLASGHADAPIKHAVISVPASFNDLQRHAIKNAGRIAGINVLRLLHEPTAAAVTHCVENWSDSIRTVLVFDLGGGTVDCSIILLEQGIVEALANAGDTNLGGNDFDHRLVDHFAQIFKTQTGKNVFEHPTSLYRLKQACERAKKQLSNCLETFIEIPCLVDDIDFSHKIYRWEFEQLNLDLFERCMDLVDTAISDSKIPSKTQIHEIVLVGGSTYIPKIRQLLKGKFVGVTFCENIDPQEAVVRGVAIQASILQGATFSRGHEVLLLEVNPFSLVTEGEGGQSLTLIPKNSTIPKKKDMIYTTKTDNQTNLTIDLFEGEKLKLSENNFSGSYELSGICPAPSGKPRLDVTFDLDANGILGVNVVDKANLRWGKIGVYQQRGCLTAEQVEQKHREFQKYEEPLYTPKENAEALNPSALVDPFESYDVD